MAVIAIHPGEHLAEELKELGISPTELARQLDVPANRVTQILKGSRAITADTAFRLGHYFGISPRFWLDLQCIYDLRLAEQSTGRAVQSLPTMQQSIPA
jgi:antitoxin HigA-1